MECIEKAKKHCYRPGRVISLVIQVHSWVWWELCRCMRYVLMTTYCSDRGNEVENCKGNMLNRQLVGLGTKLFLFASFPFTNVHGKCCHLSMWLELFFNTSTGFCQHHRICIWFYVDLNCFIIKQKGKKSIYKFNLIRMLKKVTTYHQWLLYWNMMWLSSLKSCMSIASSRPWVLC